jgi:hypothetical protein
MDRRPEIENTHSLVGGAPAFLRSSRMACAALLNGLAFLPDRHRLPSKAARPQVEPVGRFPIGLWAAMLVSYCVQTHEF